MCENSVRNTFESYEWQIGILYKTYLYDLQTCCTSNCNAHKDMNCQLMYTTLFQVWVNFVKGLKDLLLFI